MSNNSSLYGSTPPSGSVSSSNYTTLYSGGNNFVPSGDNVIISGTLTVNGCSILTDCSTFNLLPFNATTINFGGSSTAMSIGGATGVTTIQNQLSTANYLFPLADGTAGQVLITDGAGVLSFAAASTVGKTYSINASTATGGANFNLVSSDPSTDTIKFAEGTGISIVRTDADTITITNTDPGTSGVTSITGTTNQVIASNPTGAVTLSLPQDIATTSNPVFAGITGGNLTVGVVDDQTIASTNTNGDINIIPNGSGVVNLFGDVVKIGDANANAALTTNGTGNLSLHTNFNTNSGSITITQGVNGNITLAPFASGTGIVTISSDLNIDQGLRLSGSTSGYSKFNVPATGSNLDYVLPGSQGAASTVLTNDGSGNLSWALPGGGGSTFGNITIAVVDDNTISTTTGDLVLDSASNQVIANANLYVGTAFSVDQATGNIDTTGIATFKGATTGQVTIGDGSGNGGIEIGQQNRATSGSPYIDFHSSATNTDYDVRLLVSGGSATPGQGQLTIEATNIDATTAIIDADGYSVDGRGTIDSSSTTTTSTAITTINTTARTGLKCVISITDNATTQRHMLEALLYKVGTNAYLTTYAEMYSSVALATFSADVSGGALRLQATPASANSTTFTVIRTSID